jgi:hypothetical protein
VQLFCKAASKEQEKREHRAAMVLRKKKIEKSRPHTSSRFFLRDLLSLALSAARGRDPKRGEFSKRAFSKETSET